MTSKKIKRKKKRSNPKSWIAIGTLAAYTTIGSGKLASAQDRQKTPAHNTSSIPAYVQSLPAKRFDIAAGPLDNVIHAFEADTNLHVQFATDGLGEVSSPGINGRYAAGEA